MISDERLIGQPGPRRKLEFDFDETALLIRNDLAWIWHDAQFQARLVGTAFGAISQMNDRSLPAFHSTQGLAGKQPILTAGVWKGLEGFKFDGVDDFVGNTHGMDEMEAASGTKDREIIAVFIPSAGDPFRHGIFGDDANNSFDMHIGRDRFDTVNTYGLRTMQTGVPETWPSMGSFPGVGTPVVWDLQGEDWTTGGKWSSWVNGAQVCNRCNAGTVTSFGNGPLLFGKSAGTAERFLDGYLLEIMVFNFKLTNEQRRRVTNYLMYKWKL